MSVIWNQDGQKIKVTVEKTKSEQGIYILLNDVQIALVTCEGAINLLPIADELEYRIVTDAGFKIGKKEIEWIM